MTKIRERSTSEVVILVGMAVVSLTILIGLIGVIVLAVVHPDMDTDWIVQELVGVVKLILVAALGYGAGKVVPHETVVMPPPTSTPKP